MKIDKILFVSDENLNYLSFWNSISKFYKRYFNITPKLFFIGEKTEKNKIYLSEEYGEVEIIKPLSNVPIIIQALWGKFWFTQTELDTNWLIGDIDLYLLNKKYFEDSMALIPNDGYGHINANGYKMGNWWENMKAGIPGYFHCASGSKFKEFLQLSNSFEEDCLFILNSKKYGILNNGLISDINHAPERVKDKVGFEFICCEENLSTERLSIHKDEITSITYPSDLIRIETPYAMNGQATPYNFDLMNIFNLIDKDRYIDFHSPRPYTAFKDQIEKIISFYA